jgi:4-amino-4-deoxy-L-arabinose transferase-like glycosyltransferase
MLSVQLSSLYVTPIHDSYLWWGDESWLMAEYQEQIMTGVFRHPNAVGSTLSVGNPFPIASMWVTSLLYGTASFLVNSKVDAGRTLTAFLSLALLAVVYLSATRLGMKRIVALICLVLLASSRTFFLTSHSARYDIITALAIVVAVAYLAGTKANVVRAHLLIGICVGAGILISAHVTLLLALPLALWLLYDRANVKQVLLVLVGGAISVAALWLVHQLTQPAVPGLDTFSANLSTIPVLRPFSRSVQLANLEQKLELVQNFASVVVGAFLLAGYVLIANSNLRRSALLLLLPAISWLFLQSAGPSSYLIHFLPCLILAAGLALDHLATKRPKLVIPLSVVTVLFASGLGIYEASVAAANGRRLTENNSRALQSVLRPGEIYISLNPGVSYLDRNRAKYSTAHFVELPQRGSLPNMQQVTLITYNSEARPGFIWEVMPLRSTVTAPDTVIVGQFLDVGRSYFAPLSTSNDSLFVQPISDLSALYRSSIR